MIESELQSELHAQTQDPALPFDDIFPLTATFSPTEVAGDVASTRRVDLVLHQG